MVWEHLVFPVVEQDPIGFATIFQFWRKDIEKAGGTGGGIGTGFQSALSDKGQICSFKLHTGPESDIYTELLAPSNLFLGWLRRMCITALGSSII